MSMTETEAESKFTLATRGRWGFTATLCGLIPTGMVFRTLRVVVSITEIRLDS